MMRSYSDKIHLNSKSFLLMGVYMLHFIFFLCFYSSSFDSNNAYFKSFFSIRQDQKGSNTNIAVFRTIEKHEAAKRIVKDVQPIVIERTLLSSIVGLHAPQSASDPARSYLRLPDHSYRRYLSIRSLLI
jgi:hypothetical protein